MVALIAEIPSLSLHFDKFRLNIRDIVTHKSNSSLEKVCPLLLILVDVILESLFKDVILSVYFVFVSINHALPIHGVLVDDVRIVIVEVYLITYLKIRLGELAEQVNHEGTFRLIFLKHSEYKFLQVVRVSNLKGLWVLVQNFIHEAFNIVVVKRHLQSSHVVHYDAKTEHVRSVVIRLLLYYFWTQVERSAHLL